VPAIVNGKIQKFFFKEEDMVAAFHLNTLYAKCKEKKPAQQQPALEETKKTN